MGKGLPVSGTLLHPTNQDVPQVSVDLAHVSRGASGTALAASGLGDRGRAGGAILQRDDRIAIGGEQSLRWNTWFHG